MRHVLLSLHDVAPVHQARIERAEALFAAWGVEKITYLLIPDYHRHGQSDTDAFATWCRRPRPFEIDWFLHGYYHLEDTPGAGHNAALGEQIKRRYATAGEGEFLALGAEAARTRIARGTDVFERCLGYEPHGFVPPAWLYNETLPPLLAERGFRYFEDRGSVFDLETGRSLAAPVVTWATRTPLRKWTSVAGTPLLQRLWHRRPLLRLAVHPFDFDHPETIASIRRVWERTLGGRKQVFYEEVMTGAGF